MKASWRDGLSTGGSKQRVMGLGNAGAKQDFQRMHGAMHVGGVVCMRGREGLGTKTHHGRAPLGLCSWCGLGWELNMGQSLWPAVGSLDLGLLFWASGS